MNTHIDTDDDIEDQDDDIDISSTELTLGSSQGRKEKQINKEARRKIESYLEERYLANELRDIFSDDYAD